MKYAGELITIARMGDFDMGHRAAVLLCLPRQAQTGRSSLQLQQLRRRSIGWDGANDIDIVGQELQLGSPRSPTLSGL